MVVVQVGDHVEIIGGSAHVGKTGILKTKTKVMASVELDGSGINVKKKKKFLAKYDLPTEKENKRPSFPSNNDDNKKKARTLAELQAEQENRTAATTDVLITVPSITDGNMVALLASAAQAMELVCGKNSLVGNGIVHRTMKELKFKLSSPENASLVVEHFKATPMILEGQHCSVSYSEPGKTAPGEEPKRLVPAKRQPNNRPTASGRGNHAARPAGRSLFDRIQDGSSKRRRW